MKIMIWVPFVSILISCQEVLDTKYHLEGMQEWRDAKEQHTAMVQETMVVPERRTLSADHKPTLKFVLQEWDAFALKNQIVYVMVADSLLEWMTKGELVTEPVQIFIFPSHFHKLENNPITLKSTGAKELPQYVTTPDSAVYSYRTSESVGFDVMFNKGAWNASHSYQFFMLHWGTALGVFRVEEIGKRYWMQSGDLRIFLPQDPYGYLNRTFPKWRSLMHGKKVPDRVKDPSLERIQGNLDPLFEQMTPEYVMKAVRPVAKVEGVKKEEPKSEKDKNENGTSEKEVTP